MKCIGKGNLRLVESNASSDVHVLFNDVWPICFVVLHMWVPCSGCSGRGRQKLFLSSIVFSVYGPINMVGLGLGISEEGLEWGGQV